MGVDAERAVSSGPVSPSRCWRRPDRAGGLTAEVATPYHRKPAAAPSRPSRRQGRRADQPGETASYRSCDELRCRRTPRALAADEPWNCRLPRRRMKWVAEAETLAAAAIDQEADIAPVGGGWRPTLGPSGPRSAWADAEWRAPQVATARRRTLPLPGVRDRQAHPTVEILSPNRHPRPGSRPAVLIFSRTISSRWRLCPSSEGP